MLHDIFMIMQRHCATRSMASYRSPATQARRDGISDSDIVGLNIPNGQPLVYELDADLKPIKSYYLGDQSAIEAALKAVANQGKSK